jgi:hypothetical protein
MFWDLEITQIDLDNMLEEKLRTIEDIESQIFFCRLLTSCNWYTLLKLMPPKKLRSILSNPILNKLFPKDLKEKYIYAREVLSRHLISVTR